MRSIAALVSTAAILAGIIIGAGAADPPARAAEGPGEPGQITWGVRPSTPNGPDVRGGYDFTADAGTTITDWVAVTNYSDQDATFRVYAADATNDYETGAFTLIGAERPSADLGSWTSVDGKQAACPAGDEQAQSECAAGLGATITVPAGQRADMPITITIPADATPGDHAAGIVASFQSTTSDGGTTVQREDRVGTRVYLRVNGDLHPQVDVRGASGGYQGSWNPFGAGAGTVDFELANTGNARATVNTAVQLTGPFGIPLGTQQPAQVQDLVPGSIAHVTVAFDGVPPLLLLWGHVDATAVPAGGGAAVQADDEAVAWAVPWSLLALVALAGGGAWLWLVLRRRRRAAIAADLAEYTRAQIERDRQQRAKEHAQ